MEKNNTREQTTRTFKYAQPACGTLVAQSSAFSAQSPCMQSTKETIHNYLHVVLTGLSRNRYCVGRAMVAVVTYGV